MSVRLKTVLFITAAYFLSGPAHAQPEMRLLEPNPVVQIAPLQAPLLTTQPEPRQDPIGALIEQQKAPPKPRLTATELIAGSEVQALATAPLGIGEQSAMILRLQVMLDRAHASPGVIDGYNGDNVAKAVAAVEAMLGLLADGVLDQQVWSTLTLTHPAPPLTTYTIKPEDVAGPFVPDMPKDYAEMAKLERLAYRDPLELLAEKFHMSEDLLRQLNPSANLSEAGTAIIVANVAGPASAKVVRLIADKGKRRLLGFDASGTLVVSYPATIGSSDLPSPVGTHLVRTIATDPEYWYRPKVNFQQGNNTQALRLAPGPNNPVGSAWIGLDKPTYGIHGTPSPNKIDKTNSHGCVRLTNWDVRELAKLVQPGVVVTFLEPDAGLPEPEVVGSIAKR
ncbi:L,D-transpeptidase [Microvirga antarctica]|uniref:L,D-transpeptidase n=1 Tax=Microvirga antarctica TaxID=2819233 RepID=UPI001B3014E7|nr:L,D-transpeptidase [Microvirga antarctica]